MNITIITRKFMTLLALAGIISFVSAGVVVVSGSASAIAAPSDAMQEGVDSIGGKEASESGNLGDFISGIVNVLLYILGAIAVIMIVIGGIKYTTSNGDASSVKSAKDTILYAVIGLIVAILAYAIVKFIITSFSGK